MVAMQHKLPWLIAGLLISLAVEPGEALPALSGLHMCTAHAQCVNALCCMESGDVAHEAECMLHGLQDDAALKRLPRPQDPHRPWCLLKPTG